MLEDKSKDKDTTRKVKKLAEDVNKLSWDHKMGTFTGKIKHSASNNGGNQPGPSVHWRGDTGGHGALGGATEQLKAHRYEVVLDVFKMVNHTQELVSKVQH